MSQEINCIHIGTAYSSLQVPRKSSAILLFLGFYALYNLVGLQLNPDIEFIVLVYNLISFDMSMAIKPSQ